jgi:hypothetical protein
MQYLRILFAVYGITHAITIVKVAWLALTLASIVLKFIAAWKYRRLPGFASHMLVASCSAALQSSKFWGLWGEILFSLTAFALTCELHFTSCVPVEYRVERKYIFGVLQSLAACGVSGLFYFQPHAPVNYPTHLFNLHLYTVAACCAACAGSFVFHSVRRTAQNKYILTWPAVLWFGASTWAGIMGPVDFFRVGITAIIVQIGCLLTWIMTTFQDPAEVLVRREE